MGIFGAGRAIGVSSLLTGSRGPGRGNKIIVAGPLTLMAVTLVSFTAACGASQPVRDPGVGAVTIAKLRNIARVQAAVSGDRLPRVVEAVATSGSRGIAAAAPGGSYPVWPHEVVFVISMTGHFAGGRFTSPTGVALKGTILDIVLNAKTFRVMAMSLGTKPTDLSALGRPFRLSWS
jgi:hypothetical protein